VSLLLISGAKWAYSQEIVKDTVFLYHGQMLLGEVLSVTEGRLQLDSDDAGVVKIKYYKIVTFSASRHFYRIRIVDSQILYGRILTSEKEGFVKVENLGQSIEIPIESIIRIERYDNTFKDRMSGDASVGYDYTRSSNVGRISFDVGLKYQAQKYEVTMQGNAQWTQQDGSLSRDIENATFAYSRYIGYRWTYGAQFRYQRNLELSIKRRYQETIGVGYYLVQKNNMQFALSTGVSVNQELSTEGLAPGSLWELPLATTFDLYEFRNPNLQLSTIQTVYFGLTQQGRIRSDGSIKFTWEIISDVKTSINFYTNFDNQPPDDNSSNADYGIVLSLGYKFY
jgi:hypothetical protein